MNVSIVFPRHWIDKEDPQSWVLSKAITAISKQLPRIEKVHKATENYNVKTYLSRSLLAVLAGKPDDMSMSQFIVERAYAAHLDGQKSANHGDTRRSLTSLRPEQVQLITGMNEGIQREKIVLAEAATGSGKTRSALVSAAHFIQSSRQPVVYAVPTLAGINHVVKEWSELTPTILNATHPIRLSVVLGKRAFVDLRVFEDMLENPGEIFAESIEQAKAWMKSGGTWVAGSKTEDLHRLASMLWLVEDLQAAAPGFPAHECAISEASTQDNEGLQAYYALRQAALTADIVVCTHAMLGIDALRQMGNQSSLGRQLSDAEFELEGLDRQKKAYLANKIEKRIENLKNKIVCAEGVHAHKGILPNYDLLIVDEAHQLESSLASIRTSNLNPRILSKDIRKNLSAFAAIKQKTTALTLSRELMRLHIALSRFSSNIDINIKKVDLKSIPEHHDVTSIVSKLQKLPLNKLVSAPVLRSELHSLSVVLNNISSKYAEAIWVNFSPRRRFPSLYTGPRTLRPLLEKIWSQARASCLVSATLSVNDSCYFIAEQLSIPARRMHVLSQITQSWLYRPSLKVHAEDALSRPKHDSEPSKMNAWYLAIANKIADLSKNTNGGTLVLNTSYEIIDALAELLTPRLGSRLVVQSREKNLGLSLMEFEGKHLHGMHPIWLGAGSAWTGLDIMDRTVSAEDDTLLSHLIITTIPFGTNQSTTHKARTERRIKFEFDRAALELKQGLGRIMRRDGLIGRTIDILDPRVQGKRPNYGIFKTMIAKYERTHD